MFFLKILVFKHVKEVYFWYYVNYDYFKTGCFESNSKGTFWYYVKYDYSKTRHIVLNLKVFFWYRVKNDCSKTMLDLKFSVRTFGTMLNMIVLKLCV